MKHLLSVIAMVIIALVSNCTLTPLDSPTPVSAQQSTTPSPQLIDAALLTGADDIRFHFQPESGTLHDLTVVVNDTFTFYPANFGGIDRFELAGEILRPWQFKHTSEIINQVFVDGVYGVTFRWGYEGDFLDFTIRMWVEGQTFWAEFSSDSAKVRDFTLDRSLQTLRAKIVELPYGHNVLYTEGLFLSSVIDPFFSNASVILPMKSDFAEDSAFFGNVALYHSLTDGSHNPLRERVAITVSPNIEEVFYHPPQQIAPYRDALVPYVVIDLWRSSFAAYKQDIEWLANAGLTDLFIIIHQWQTYGFDNGFPTTHPAGDSYGGEIAARELAALCQQYNYRCAFHTNYVDFYKNSNDWNVADVALNPDSSWMLGWFNSITEIQSYVIKPTRVLHYATLYEPAIQRAYQTGGAFLDVHTAVLPGYRTDHDAAVPDAGKQVATYQHYRDLVEYARDVHEGPVMGEGMGFSTAIWAGVVDGIEADPRSFFDVSTNAGGNTVPTIVDYKLRVLHHRFVPHGVGYLDRFYPDKWFRHTVAELERYRATELAFGNAGFVHNSWDKENPLEEVIREVRFLQPLQQRYLAKQPVAIHYWVDNQWLTLSDALRAILPDTDAADVKTTLAEVLGIVRVEYTSGLILTVNRSTNRTLDLTKDWPMISLPPNGFFARDSSGILAYFAQIEGTMVDFIRPSRLSERSEMEYGLGGSSRF